MHQVDHPFTGEATRNESGKETHKGCHRRKAAHGLAEANLKHVLNVEQGLTQNGRDDTMALPIASPSLSGEAYASSVEPEPLMMH